MLDSRIIFAFAFSAIIFVESIVLLCKAENSKAKTSGWLSLITGIMFIAATVIGVVRNDASSDALLLAEWLLYIVGLIIFIIALIVRKSATSSK